LPTSYKLKRGVGCGLCRALEATMLTGEWVSRTKSSKIFHAMSWNICGIFNFRGKFHVMWQNI